MGSTSLQFNRQLCVGASFRQWRQGEAVLSHPVPAARRRMV